MRQSFLRKGLSFYKNYIYLSKKYFQSEEYRV